MSRKISFQLRICAGISLGLAGFAYLAWQYYFHEHAIVILPGLPILLFLMAVLYCAELILFMRKMETAGVFKDAVPDAKGNPESETGERERIAGGEESFFNACHDLFQKQGVQDISDKVMKIIEETMDADQGSLMLLGENQKLKIVASRGLSESVASETHVNLGERVAGLAAYEKKEFLINGNLQNYPLFQDLEVNPIIRSSIVCPIECQGKVLGVLNISRTRNAETFTRDDLKRARFLARIIGLAIHHDSLCQDLETKAHELGRTRKDLSRSREALFRLDRSPERIWRQRAKAS